MCVRNIDQLLLARPQPGTWPTIQVPQLIALTGNRTGDLSVCKTEVQPTEPHQSGWELVLTDLRLLSSVSYGLGLSSMWIF